MKTVDYYWDHPDLKSLKKKFRKGDCLFKMGESAKTMYVITQGIVQLTGEREDKELVISYVGAGEFLGEMAILKPDLHRRVFGAYAISDLVCLELGISDLEALEKKNPRLAKNILKHMFLLAAKRLSQSSYLLRALRPSNNIVRLLSLIVFLARTTGVNTPDGIEFLMTIDQIRYYIDMSEFEVEESIKELVKNGIIVSRGDHIYAMSDDQAVLGSAGLLKEALPSMTAID